MREIAKLSFGNLNTVIVRCEKREKFVNIYFGEEIDYVFIHCAD